MKKPKTKPLGAVKLTERKFQYIEFKDRYGTPCSLQQSSIADYIKPGSSAIWLGIDRQTDVRDGVFDAANMTRMHLDLEQVKSLIVALKKWVNDGVFEDSIL
jgi:hypothetical protein